MNTKKTLLPSGFYDVLPSQAELEDAIIRQIGERFRQFGYSLVRPTLMEFASQLQTAGFFTTDPQSGEMLRMRSDITPQISRLVQERFVDAPRPLRLCYSGAVLKPKAADKHGQRQQQHIGLEHVGEADSQHIALVLSIALQALQDSGVEDVVVELTHPAKVAHLVGNNAVLHKAIEKKEAHILTQHPALQGLREDTLLDGISAIIAHRFDIACTVDLLDIDGADYYAGPAFSLLHPHTQECLGNGGVYHLPNGEAACGFSMQVSAIARASNLVLESQQETLSFNTAWNEILHKHTQDIITIIE